MGKPQIYDCQPASRIIDLLGGSRRVAEHCNLDVGTVNRWRRPAQAGGCDGEIPRRYRAQLITLAKRSGHELTWIDFAWVGPAESAVGDCGQQEIADAR